MKERETTMGKMQSADGYPGPNEPTRRKVETGHAQPQADEDQSSLNYLMDNGFDWDEAVTLLDMHEHIYENVEMHQRMADDSRIHFARWLYAHGMMNED
jgi:hypothetical protein